MIFARRRRLLIAAQELIDGRGSPTRWMILSEPSCAARGCDDIVRVALCELVDRPIVMFGPFGPNRFDCRAGLRNVFASRAMLFQVRLISSDPRSKALGVGSREFAGRFKITLVPSVRVFVEERLDLGRLRTV